MMAFANLREEVEELFAETQDAFEHVTRDCLRPGLPQSSFHGGDDTQENGGGDHTRYGMHIVRDWKGLDEHHRTIIRDKLQAGEKPQRIGRRWREEAADLGITLVPPTPGPKSEDRKAKNREYMRRRAEDVARAALLAGERPVLGKRGRPPTVWIRVAAELGITLPRGEAVERTLNQICSARSAAHRA